MNDQERDLLADYIHGHLPPEKHTALNELLRRDPDAREWLRTEATLETRLRELALASEARPARFAPPVRGLRWRPLPAAAAGLVIGLFCASIVWAYAIPIQAHSLKRVVAVLSESFENADAAPHHGFPRGANEWSGDMALVSNEEADVQPAEGRHMMRLNRKPTWKLAYAWLIVDLADYPAMTQAESWRMEVSAKFNTPPVERSLRYQIRLAALSQTPAEVRDIWNNEPLLFDIMLQHASRNVEVKPGERGWRNVEASMEIPPGTRSVVISLAAGEIDAGQPPVNHYLDAVQAHFVITKAATQ